MLAVVIFILALIFRLILSPLAFHVDILSNAAWGQWIYLHGPLGFYQNNIWIYSWPTQPPFVSLVYGFDNWLYVFLLQAFRNIGNIIVQYHLAPGHLRFWFEFTKWFDTAKVSNEAIFSIGYLATIKILPIIADLGIAGVIYFIAKQNKKIKFPIIWPAVYLFSPFSWYLSALWGQYDQLSFLPLLLSLVLVGNRKLDWASPFLFAISVALKPTSLILVPLFIYSYFKSHPKKISIVISGILIALFYFATTQVFTSDNIFRFTQSVLVGKIFFKAASRLSANAFNFWRIFESSSGQTHDVPFLFIPAFFWSLAFYLGVNFAMFKKLKAIGVRSILTWTFIISGGSWLFMTDMLDRYFFIGIVTGLIVSIYDSRLFKYWLILSLIFFLNLFNQWWFPDFLAPIKLILTWQNGLISKALSLIDVLVFIRMAMLLKHPSPLQARGLKE